MTMSRSHWQLTSLPLMLDKLFLLTLTRQGTGVVAVASAKMLKEIECSLDGIYWASVGNKRICGAPPDS